jgi:hypothetical protein
MRRLRRHPVLVLATAGLAALEATLIVAIGPADASPLAPQVAAPAPFGVFHDLRWLLVYHPSWTVFVVGFTVLVAVRALLDRALVRAAWPDDVPPPSPRAHLVHTLRFTGVVAGALFLFVVLSFALAVTSLSWLFFVAVPVLVMIALLVHHGEVLPSWWRDRPPAATVVTILSLFVVLTAGGAFIAVVPPVVAPVIAAAVGIGVAACRAHSVDVLAHRAIEAGDGPAEKRWPFAVIGLAGVVALVVVGTAVGFAVSVAIESGRTHPPRVTAGATGSPVLVVKGFNSRWDGITYRWVRGRHRIRRFSYRGLGAGGRPLPYERDDTHRSVVRLAREMRRQVEVLHRATGRPVGIVAESEGALVAQVYLAATPRAPVDAVVLLSPLAQPGRVFYPPAGDEGWGVASGATMRAIAAVVGMLGPVDVSADEPLFRSIVDLGPTVGSLLACPPPGVRAYAVLPIDEGVSAPAPLDVGYPHRVVPAFHGGLLGDDGTARSIAALLDGRPPPHGSAWWAGIGDVVNALAAPWQAPSLVPSLEPRWRDQPDANDCRAVRTRLRRLVGATPRTASG